MNSIKIKKVDGSITTLDKYPWYLKDKYGWPIGTFKNKPVLTFLRIICQNIRKIVG